MGESKETTTGRVGEDDWQQQSTGIRDGGQRECDGIECAGASAVARKSCPSIFLDSLAGCCPGVIVILEVVSWVVEETLRDRERLLIWGGILLEFAAIWEGEEEEEEEEEEENPRSCCSLLLFMYRL